MEKIISILNFKGGVGKSTTVHSLGSALTLKGKKVLVVDLDPQASLTFASLEDVPEKTIYDVFVKNENINNVIVKTDKFDILPSNLVLNIAERNLMTKYGVEHILERALKSVEGNYDYILIDCPPSLNLFTANALTASKYVIIPCETEIFALDGLNLLQTTLKEMIDGLGLEIEKMVILPTKLHKGKSISKEVFEVLTSREDAAKSSIRTCSKLNLLGLEKQSIFEIDPKCTGAEDYNNLADEVESWDC